MAFVAGNPVDGSLLDPDGRTGSTGGASWGCAVSVMAELPGRGDEGGVRESRRVVRPVPVTAVCRTSEVPALLTDGESGANAEGYRAAAGRPSDPESPVVDGQCRVMPSCRRSAARAVRRRWRVGPSPVEARSP